MNKKQLTTALSKRFFLSKKESNEILDFILDEISITLKLNQRFYIRGFGSFTKQKIASKKVRHPKTKEIITIPEKETIRFNPSKDLLEKT
jgi:nucleoid DNA-binding protein